MMPVLYQKTKVFSRPTMDGYGAAFDRNGSGNVFDWKGLINNMAAHITRQQGLRTSINLFHDVDITDVSNWTIDGAVTFSYEGNGIFRIQNISAAGVSEAVISPIVLGSLNIENRDFIPAFEIWNADGNNRGVKFTLKRQRDGTVSITTINSSISTGATSSDTAEIFTPSSVLTGNVNNLGLIFEFQSNPAATPSDDFYFRFPTIEEVTGQANQVTSGAIPVDTPEGPNSVINGGFDVDSGWTTQNVTIASGVAVLTSDGTRGVLHQAHGLILGKSYVADFDISSLTGSMDFAIRNTGGTSISFTEANIITEGHKSFVFNHSVSGANRLHFQCGSNSSGGFTLDNISIRPATTGHKSLNTTNGNSVTDNVVTEAPGLTLHPQKPFRLPGHHTAERFLRPDIIKNTTAYSLGDIVHTSAQVFPGCGNGYYYECTTAGTTDGSVTGESDTWTETIGNTATNNSVVFTNRGHLKYSGMAFAPASTNITLRSEDQSTVWLNAWGGGVTITLNDAVAPNGHVTMDKLTGIDSNNDGNNQQITLAAATVHFASWHVKNVDSTKSILRIYDNNAAATLASLVLDWTGGVPSTNSVFGTTLIRYDRIPGTDIYRISFKFTTAGVVTTHQVITEPDGVNTQKSIHVWGIQVEENLLTPYISTLSTTVTRPTEADALNYTIAQIMHNDTEGWFSVDLMFDVDKADLDVTTAQRLFSLNTSTTNGLSIDTAEVLILTEGTNFQGREWTSKHIIYRLAARWNTALDELQLFLNNTTGSVASYDDSFNDDGFLHYFENITELICWQSNFNWGTKDPGSAALLAHTAYDQVA